MPLSPRGAQAQLATASASVGGGTFGASASAVVDLGIDLTGADFAVGVGARLRFVSGEGLRRRDWDERSELAHLLRYAVYRYPVERGGIEFSAAAGELGGAVVGHATIVSGYGSGVHADHGRLGAQLRLRADEHEAEGLVDDVVAPRIAAVRGQLGWRALHLGLTTAADFSAPRGSQALGVGLIGAEAELAGHSQENLRGAVYADAVAALGRGGGLHLGVLGDARSDALLLSLRAEINAGSAGYTPGWFGPLYEVERASRLDLSAAGMLGGIGAHFEFGGELEPVGAIAVSYALRGGLPNVLALRLAAPHYRRMQAALSAALGHQGGAVREAALAAELRARLTNHLFASTEAARLYRDEDGVGLAPFWTFTAAIGGVLGEESE
jgi:hypothetical protein